jgi:hypothetical protein
MAASRQVEFFLQPEGTASLEGQVEERQHIAQSDAAYAPLREAAANLIQHLSTTAAARSAIVLVLSIMFHYHLPAATAFKERWGPKSVPSETQVVDYLLCTPPDLILVHPTELQAGSPRGTVILGIVDKARAQ